MTLARYPGPSRPGTTSRLATFTARLREHGILDLVTAALCQLARSLDDNGAPVDYARRRRLRRFSQTRLDTDSWRRQRYFLTHPATWAQRRHLDHADLPATPVQEQLARLRLIELLTGTHPRYLPGPLRLPDRRSQDYAEFVFTMPQPMARCLHQQARALLAHAGVHEPAPDPAALGGPGAFTEDVWNVFTRPGAEQRIRRLLTLPGQPSLQHAARQLGVRTAILTGQVRQLETTVGTALLRTGPDGRLTLTAYGQRFASDVRPALKSITQSQSQTTRHAP